METFFRIPAEIRQEVLFRLSAEDLEKVFSLRSLPSVAYPYITVVHQALAAWYSHQDLVISDATSEIFFSLSDLNYLIKHQILIVARSVSFVLHVTLERDVPCMLSLWQKYFHVLQRSTKSLNIHVLLNENVLSCFLMPESWLGLFSISSFKVNWLTIKYSTGAVSEHSNFVISEAKTNCGNGKVLGPENLKLQFFNPEKLLRHIAHSKKCHLYTNLKTIDLSFNNITDEDLGRIEFLETLEQINLLNNSILVLNNSNFSFDKLFKLRILNLSNNNIRHFQLRDLPEQTSFLLKDLDLSGNVLGEYSTILNCRLFERIENLNLSNNLISQLSPFPECVRHLDLCGNRYCLADQNVVGIFPRNLELLHLSMHSPALITLREFSPDFVRTAGLLNLKLLKICGNCCINGYLGVGG